MNIGKRILGFFLCAVLLFSASACGKKKKDVPNAIVPDEETEITDTLHKVNVTESSRPFIVNGATEYKILIPQNSASAKKAADFLSLQTQKATGAVLPVETAAGATWTQNAKYIVFNNADMFSAAGLSMPSDELGTSGYYIKTAGNSVFIMTLADKAFQYAAISFLRNVLGYEMFWQDCTVFEKDGKTLPDMEITERPDFDTSLGSWGASLNADSQYGMGFSTALDTYIYPKSWVHNTFEYLPKDTHQDEHPEWYSTTNDQLCYTAHGSDTFELMVQTVADAIIAACLKYPERSLVSFTQNDNTSECGCETCSAHRAIYGTSSAAVIRFVNKVDDIVQKYFADVAAQTGERKREIKIIFFAYYKYMRPPVTANADGTYSPMKEYVLENGQWVKTEKDLVCNENVGIYFAPLPAKYSVPLSHSYNSVYAEALKGWSALTSTMCIWLYQTNFHYYLYPLNSYESSMDSYRFIRKYSGTLMGNQGQHNGGTTHFQRLKNYIDSVSRFNVNVSYKDVVDRFFTYYYADAAQPMRKFFDQLVQWMGYLETMYPESIDGTIYNEIEKSEYWRKKTLDTWMALIDEGYAAIEHYKESDPEYYQTLKMRIVNESLFPRYALIRLHSGSYNADTLYAMRRSFMEDANAVGLLRHAEGSNALLEGVYASWGL